MRSEGNIEKNVRQAMEGVGLLDPGEEPNAQGAPLSILLRQAHSCD